MRKKIICKECGKKRFNHSRGLCDTCYHRELGKEKRRLGICVSCRSRNINFFRSTYHCDKCLDLMSRHTNENERYNRALGLCAKCGRLSYDNYRCERCRQLKRLSYRRTHKQVSIEELYEINKELEKC